jgi:hypothetical protein
MKRFGMALAIVATMAVNVIPAQALVTVKGYPVKVSACDPELNQRVTHIGYFPGYYPAAPFYWNDVYGYRYYQPPMAANNPQLSIDYANVTRSVITKMEFGLLANGRLVAEVRDVGTFSPNAEIKHTFGISQNVFPLQTGMPRCVPLKATFADGSVWRNPHLPALRRTLYGP